MLMMTRSPRASCPASSFKQSFQLWRCGQIGDTCVPICRGRWSQGFQQEQSSTLVCIQEMPPVFKGIICTVIPVTQILLFSHTSEDVHQSLLGNLQNTQMHTYTHKPGTRGDEGVKEKVNEQGMISTLMQSQILIQIMQKYIQVCG